MPDNTVTPPQDAAQTPSSAGQPDVNTELAKLRDENARLMRESQGFKHEMLSEREKRQELERSRNAAASTTSDTVLKPASNDDERLIQAVKPLYDQVVSLQHANEETQALSWLAKKEKLDVEDLREIKQSPAFKELTETISRYHLGNMPMVEGVKAAYRLMLKDRADATKTTDAGDVNRDKAIAANTPAPAVGVPSSGDKVVQISAKDIASMSLSEFQALKERAAKAGETISVVQK